MITGDAQRNVDFYADTLGLRLVKKTVNFDAPEAYHLYFGGRDRRARHDPDLVRVPRRARRAARARARSTRSSSPSPRRRARLLGRAPGACETALATGPALRGPRRAQARARRLRRRQRAAARRAPGDPGRVRDHRHRRRARLRAFHGVEEPLLTDVARLHLRRRRVRLDGSERRFRWAYDAPPAERALQGAGSVHHIAWASRRRGPPRRGRRASPRPAGSSPTSATATTSSRSTSASRAACCSRSPRSRPASRSTRTRSTSARRCACPSSTSTCAPQLEQMLTPVTNPRARRSVR